MDQITFNPHKKKKKESLLENIAIESRKSCPDKTTFLPARKSNFGTFVTQSAVILILRCHSNPPNI